MASFRSKSLLILTISTIGIFISACNNNKSIQCQQIYLIAEDIATSNKIDSTLNESTDSKTWLQAAAKFEREADNLGSLKIEPSELTIYQDELATLYRLYASATYDAVRARKNKDLMAFNLARENAVRAGLVQQELIDKINGYCLSDREN